MPFLKSNPEPVHDFIENIDLVSDPKPDTHLPEVPDKYNNGDIGSKYDEDGNVRCWYNISYNDRTKIRPGDLDQAEFSFRITAKQHWGWQKWM